MQFIRKHEVTEAWMFRRNQTSESAMAGHAARTETEGKEYKIKFRNLKIRGYQGDLWCPREAKNIKLFQ
jgi:hypothetical protein